MGLFDMVISRLDRSPLPRPECAVCGTPVHSVTLAHNMDTQSFEFRFWCHGEREKVTLSQQEVEQLFDGLKLGRCFENSPRLKAPEPLALPSEGDKP